VERYPIRQSRTSPVKAKPADDLPGKPVSLWLETSPESDFPQLTSDLTVDVAVTGAGITGVTTALLLKEAGATVALLESGRVGAGVTGHTTAKVTSLHALTYSKLYSDFGDEGARAYGEANQAGLERIAQFVEELEIDCDFRRKPNYTYTESADDRGRIEDEVSVAMELGLPAAYTETTDLPFDVAAAIRFEDQAEFHPHKYVVALASRIPGNGCHLFERSQVLGVDDEDPCVVRTASGRVTAEQVVIATHMPILDRGLYFARVHPERSYVVAARLRGSAPAGMYLSTEKPPHSIRAHPFDGGELLLVGGESHKTGQKDSSDRLRALARWAESRFDVERIEYRWATQDNMPADGMPFVGRLWPLSDRLYTATGFKKWGLANGTAAAMILSDLILQRPNPWATTFNPFRLNLRAAVQDLVKENADAGFHFFADRVRNRGSAADLRPGEGKVVRAGIGQAAVYKDEQGRVHSLSARCTHLGCIVAWNSAEKTWDCPCHGSRFSYDGEVVQGPAVKQLERRE
jgi:glycine/D-amino acid oxidase-like deaminating enzyme/nitrite reductase/ring-hydroxylating ferredoxin subunit